MTYDYPNDGKLHTRFSELVRCTDGQIERVLAERNGDQASFSSNITYFGDIRHEMLKEYIQENGKIPEKFGVKLSCKPDRAEKHIAVEVFPNVVIHGTPDCFGNEWIADFKTTSRTEKAYSASKQVLFYAWLLSFYGLKIEKGYYLCEIWDKERTKILDYKSHQFEVDSAEFDELVLWTQERVERLKSAIKGYQPVEV